MPAGHLAATPYVVNDTGVAVGVAMRHVDSSLVQVSTVWRPGQGARSC